MRNIYYILIPVLVIVGVGSWQISTLALSTNFRVSVEPLIECNDGLDNDSDGQIDYPNDPECASALDNLEAHQQCSDNYDNDRDTLIDFPDDLGCYSLADDNEENQQQCNDGLDNDSDGQIDYPNDPGCASSTDNDETDETGNSGSGPGPGPGITINPATTVTISGRAYPNQTVTLLKDAQIYVQTIAGPDSLFSIQLTTLAAGNYVFSLYSEDKNGLRSSLYSFPIFVSQGSATQISGVYIAPTIDTDKIQVKQGENITIFGQTTPQSEVSIVINSDSEHFVSTQSDSDGVYLYNFNSLPLHTGAHNTKSRSLKSQEVSPHSSLARFRVGDVNIFRGDIACSDLPADLNCDGLVNLVDFSIAAYWYKRPLSEDFALLEVSQLNGDNQINLADFSIMAYYWTG